MITSTRKSGYGQDGLLMTHVSVWDGIFETEGMIRFYPGPIGDVVDVVLKGDETTIYIYPHNSGDYISRFSAKESQIRRVVEEASKKSGNERRTAFTVDLAVMKVLDREDFDGYYARKERDSLFLFDTSPEEGGFPALYVVNRHVHSGPYSLLFDVQTLASRTVAKPTGPDTKIGKEFIFRLLGSHLQKEWQSEIVETGRFSFPNSMQENVPSFYDTTAMEAHAAIVGAEALIQTSTAVVSADDNFGKFDGESLIRKINRELIDKGTVQLSDIVSVGIAEALRQIPDKMQVVVPINQDVSGGFRKGCIWQGKIHLLTSDLDFDYASTLGANDEDFVLHTEETTYPSMTLLPAPKDSDTGKEYIN